MSLCSLEHVVLPLTSTVIWAHCLIALGFSFLLCKTDGITILPHRIAGKVQGVNIWKVLRIASTLIAIQIHPMPLSFSGLNSVP